MMEIRDIVDDPCVRVAMSDNSSKRNVPYVRLAFCERYDKLLRSYMTTGDSRSSETPETGRIPIGECIFMPQDSVEDEPREFFVTLFSDRTCQWEDVFGQKEFTLNQGLEIFALFDQRSKKQLQNETIEHSLTTSIDDEGYHLILRKGRREAQGLDVTPEMCLLIDLTLANIYWRDVNPYIWRPLTRIKRDSLG
jgi:hypothetical protein